MVGVSSRTSGRQLFKELNILTLASLYILEVAFFIRKYSQSLEQNSEVHKHNTQRNMDIHVKLHKTEICKKSVINMGTKVYNNLPGFIKEIKDYKALKKELKLFLLLHTFYSVEEFVSSQLFTSEKYNSSVYGNYLLITISEAWESISYVFKTYYRLTSLLSYV